MAAATTQWHYRKTEYRNTLLVEHKVRILNNKYKGTDGDKSAARTERRLHRPTPTLFRAREENEGSGTRSGGARKRPDRLSAPSLPHTTHL